MTSTGPYLARRFFLDDTGAQWYVQDCVFRHSRYVVLGFGSEQAEIRIFVSQFGKARLYAFATRETRGARRSHLERQLRSGRELDARDLDPALLPPVLQRTPA